MASRLWKLVVAHLSIPLNGFLDKFAGKVVVAIVYPDFQFH